MPAEYDVPTKEDVEAILALSEKENYPLYLLLRCLLKSGRRFGEFYGVQKRGVWKFGVQVKHIDFEKRWVYTYILKKVRVNTRTGKVTKGGYRKKLAFLDERTTNLVKAYVEANGMGPKDHVFRFAHYRSIQRSLRQIVSRLGIQRNITLHSFRAYFVTYCKRAGWAHEDIIKVTGHAKKETLMRYDHTDILDIEDKARKLVEEI